MCKENFIKSLIDKFDYMITDVFLNITYIIRTLYIINSNKKQKNNVVNSPKNVKEVNHA